VIIALGHRKQQGKDTVADILVAEYGFHKIAFADALYSLCYGLFKNDGFLTKGEYDQEPALKEVKLANGHKPRFLLLHFGKGLREIDPEYWVRRVESRIMSSTMNCNWVITDLRHRNEVDIVRHRLGGKLVRVDRPGHETTTYPGDIDNILAGFSEWDCILKNDLGLDRLPVRVAEMLLDLKYGH